MTGRSVIVTGGASGIGRAAVDLLAAAGDCVVIADLDVAQGEQLAARLGGNARFIRTDVSDEAQVRAMVDLAVSSFGRLDGAINCAGVPQKGRRVDQLDAVDWDRGMAINLRSMFLCIKYQVAAMWDQKSGAIVAVSSAAADKGLVNSAEYCASKAGITGLVRAAAVDCAEQGIRVNALLPGGTDTPLAVQSQANNPQIVGTLRVPMMRMASPAEVAGAAVWLLSDGASYMTGASVPVDGGMSIA